MPGLRVFAEKRARFAEGLQKGVLQFGDVTFVVLARWLLQGQLERMGNEAKSGGADEAGGGHQGVHETGRSLVIAAPKRFRNVLSAILMGIDEAR